MRLLLLVLAFALMAGCIDISADIDQDPPADLAPMRMQESQTGNETETAADDGQEESNPGNPDANKGSALPSPLARAVFLIDCWVDYTLIPERAEVLQQHLPEGWAVGELAGGVALYGLWTLDCQRISTDNETFTGPVKLASIHIPAKPADPYNHGGGQDAFLIWLGHTEPLAVMESWGVPTTLMQFDRVQTPIGYDRVLADDVVSASLHDLHHVDASTRDQSAYHRYYHQDGNLYDLVFHMDVKAVSNSESMATMEGLPWGDSTMTARNTLYYGTVMIHAPMAVSEAP